MEIASWIAPAPQLAVDPAAAPAVRYARALSASDSASHMPPTPELTRDLVLSALGSDGLFNGTSPCPTEHFDDNIVAVALAPQPPCTPCPACQLQLPKTMSGDPMILELAIEEGLSYDPSPMVLTLSNNAGPVERYDLHDAVKLALGNVTTLQRGSVYRFELPATMKAYRGELIQATIEWLDPKSLTQTTSALLIHQN
jgi:hypothetical protein